MTDEDSMTEAEWNLTKQLCETQMALAQAQAQVCQANYNDAAARLKALGDEYKAEGNG